MANVIVERVGPEDMSVVAELYNQVFRPPRDLESFQRRFLGRHNPLVLVARLEDQPVGFAMGFELKPDVFFAWFYGVHADFRRKGIGSQLMEAVHSWAHQNEYLAVRMECHNQHRAMMFLALQQEYDIVGMRWDPDRGENLILFEKMLGA